MIAFFDTEFTGLRQHAELISLAVVCENETCFYAEFTDFNRAGLSDWHKEHVLPHLLLGTEREKHLPKGCTKIKGNRATITQNLKQWLEQCGELVLWADVPAYDWVLFCELFGGALSLPANVHYIVRDLATLLEVQGLDPDLSRRELAYGAETPLPFALPQHNALADALTGLACLKKLQKQDLKPTLYPNRSGLG